MSLLISLHYLKYAHRTLPPRSSPRTSAKLFRRDALTLILRLSVLTLTSPAANVHKSEMLSGLWKNVRRGGPGRRNGDSLK